MNQVFRLSLFQHKRDNKPRPITRSWQQLCASFQKPRIRLEKDGLLFSPAYFEPALRRKENVKELSLLVLDIDHKAEFQTLQTRLSGLQCAFSIYSTHSHLRQTESNPEAEPRFRIVLPLTEPVNSDLFPSLWQCVKQATGLPLDEATKDASRIFYTPAITEKDAPFCSYIADGAFLDWRALLNSYAENVSGQGGSSKDASHADYEQKKSLFASHDERHAEVCRRIKQAAKQNSRGVFEMKCPVHGGKGETSLIYFPESQSVRCLKGCDYFSILRAFGLTDERLPKTSSDKANEKSKQSRLAPLRTVKLSEVEKKSVKWLWKPLIAQGAFTIIEGEEGIGKSWLLCAIACAIAQGYGLPNGAPSEPANVLLMSAEDSLAFTLKPRLEAMNAPCERIIAVQELFTLDADGIFRLELAIAEHEPRLIIVDPLFSYTGKTHLDKDNEIRSVTSELTRLAEKYETAIGGVRHIGKSKGMGDPRAAGLNGIGWRASARSVLLVGKDPDNEARKAIVQTKNNLAEKSETAIGFEIRDSEFFWTGDSTLTASRMLTLASTDDERAEHSEAVAFLREALSASEREANEVTHEAEKLQITPKQLRNARLKIGVLLRREGFGKGSKMYWRLPPIDDTKDTRHL